MRVDADRGEELREEFRSLYGGSCSVYRAPGRINLIGEHTDYNDGFVLPAAIQFYCWIAIAPTSDRCIEVHSVNLNQHRTFHLDRPRRQGEWSDYVQGVAVILEQSGIRLPGARTLISSEVPMGSGLSSSAALEVAAGFALVDTQQKTCDRRQLALACQRAENEFVGARCGIMDQFVACYARAGHLLMLDCRTLEHSFLRFPESVCMVICNTMVKHANAAGEYNTRRAECEEGVRLLKEKFPALSALRDLTPSDVERCEELLPAVIQKRCRHVVNENQRVLSAAAALETGDLNKLGELMAESHRSLREDYQVSSPELDLMVELANQVPGTYGSRMTGGGFGGCTVNLVAAETVSEFQNSIATAYQARTGTVPEIYVSAPCAGVQRWDDIE
ncbi:MAG TPA: galactokinase [Candidatus Angelobacter sp.]